MADAVFVLKGVQQIKLNWPATRKLKVECDYCSRENIFREMTVFGGVDIVFSGFR
jgi:hypothetical protein